MSKKVIFVVYGLAVVFLTFVTAYMYFVGDAAFLIGYGSCRFLAFAVIVIATILGIRRSSKAPIILTIFIFIVTAVLGRVVFRGSMERFLYFKNERLYHQAISKIADEGLTGGIELEGEKKRLYVGYVYVKQLGASMSVSFGMGRPGVRSQIVYTENKKALQDWLGKPSPKFEALDQGWWILRPGEK